MTTVDARFFFARTLVALVDFGPGSDGAALRGPLEAFGAVTLRHLCGAPEDFLCVLGQDDRAPPYMVLCGHGDEAGFVFGEYSSNVDTSALIEGRMPAASVGARVRLPGTVILSLACFTGRPEMAEAMLKGPGSGVGAYIAPDRGPAGPDAILFALHFFHHLIARGASYEAAWRQAAAYDDAGAMFVLYTREGPRRV